MKATFWAFLAIMIAATAWTSDVTGNWTGSMELNNGEHGGTYLILKQSDGEITGSMGSSQDKQFPLTLGRINGDVVTLEARPGAPVLRLTMKLDAAKLTKLTGDVFEDDRKIGTVAVQKVLQ